MNRQEAEEEEEGEKILFDLDMFSRYEGRLESI
jgi:hypothetical protein